MKEGVEEKEGVGAFLLVDAVHRMVLQVLPFFVFAVLVVHVLLSGSTHYTLVG